MSGNGCIPPSPPEHEPEFSWNGHRYEVISESLSWEQAKTRCESLGGHLATITSQAEQEFIAGLLVESGTYWIGARSDESGFWHWVTDEPFERQYQNYASGQPDGSGMYLMMDSSGKWDDVQSGTRGFVCEYDDEPEEVREAPLAQSFTEWLANPELREASDGAMPSPIDTSHLRNNPPRVTASALFRASDALPARYDGREEIGLPEARNQGSYNTCWAFASIGALEANYRKQGMTFLGEYPDLSELHLAWFTYKTIYSKDIDPDLLILDQLGNPEKACDYLTTVETAPVNEGEMPYSAAGDSDADIEAFLEGKTFTRSSIMLREAISLTSIEAENMSYIKSMIMEHGAVYCHYPDTASGYDETHNSFYSTVGSTHAVILVGWDDDYPAENFRNTPSINGAWLVRNSRGKDWGDNGYFWISYEQAMQTNMDQCYVFIASEDIAGPTKEQHKHDDGGETKNITPQWSANIFKAERNENIVSITFNTTDNNAEYQIYVNNLGKERPSDPGSVIGEPVFSGEMAYAGYHVLTLANPVEVYAGDYYSVIVKMTTVYDYPTAAEGSVEGYFTASVNEGESYFASGDIVPSVWVDGAELEGEAYNATVRVLTVERRIYETAPVITTTSLRSGLAGESYEFRLEAQGTGPIEWRAGKLPEGFALSREGVLSGKSDEVVDEQVKFTAMNNVGSSETTLRLKIASEDIPDEPVDHEPVDHEPQDEPVEASGSGGGGCDSGLWGVGIVLVMLFLRKRR